MNKHLLITFALLLCCTTAIALTYFYYHKGEKIYLTENEDKVCIYIPTEYEEVSERISDNVQALSSMNDENFNGFVISRSDYDHLTSLDFWEDDAKFVILAPCLFTAGNKEVHATPYFYVRLKMEEDIDLLNTTAEKYKLRIVRNSPLMPLWYILALTLDSEKNSLECANELYESGLFVSAQPDLAGAYHLTIVQGITATEEQSEFFDLQGRPLSTPPSRGMYIQDGKKVIK